MSTVSSGLKWARESNLLVKNDTGAGLLFIDERSVHVLYAGHGLSVVPKRAEQFFHLSKLSLFDLFAAILLFNVRLSVSLITYCKDCTHFFC